MSPIGMIQETRKKNWNKWRRGRNRQKNIFFWRFFPKIVKIPKQKTRLVKKRNHKKNNFWYFFEIWENRIFHWGWANRDEKLMKAPYRICSYPYKPEITIFGAVKRSKNAKNMFEKREKHAYSATKISSKIVKNSQKLLKIIFKGLKARNKRDATIYNIF